MEKIFNDIVKELNLKIIINEDNDFFETNEFEKENGKMSCLTYLKKSNLLRLFITRSTDGLTTCINYSDWTDKDKIIQSIKLNHEAFNN